MQVSASKVLLVHSFYNKSTKHVAIASHSYNSSCVLGIIFVRDFVSATIVSHWSWFYKFNGVGILTTERIDKIRSDSAK